MIVLASCSQCGGSPKCSSATCAGCCVNGVCDPGNTQAACGTLAGAFAWRAPARRPASAGPARPANPPAPPPAPGAARPNGTCINPANTASGCGQGGGAAAGGMSIDPAMHGGRVCGRFLQRVHRQHRHLSAGHHQRGLRNGRAGVPELHRRCAMHEQPLHHPRLQWVRGQHGHLSGRHHQRGLRYGRRHLPDVHGDGAMHQQPMRVVVHRVRGFERRLPGRDEQLRLQASPASPARCAPARPPALAGTCQSSSSDGGFSLSCPSPGTFASCPSSPCGVERWSIKTTTGLRGATEISTNVQTTTVAAEDPAPHRGRGQQRRQGGLFGHLGA